MRRRTLDILFSIGGVGLVILLVVAGFVLRSNANFARDYVHQQLAQEQITFKKASALTPAELAFTKARTGCLLKYAGQQLTTGPQAECWANELMLGHLRDPKHIAYANGMTYAQLGTVQSQLRNQITAAQKTNAPNLAALQKQLANVSSARDTVFQGEMLRGSLLTSYGFSVLGEKARTYSNVAFLAALILLLVSSAGLVHAFVTPRERLVAAPTPAQEHPLVHA